MNRAAFSLLEVILALLIVALVMSAIGPALVGALRAQRQARALIEPLAREQSALAVLRDDLVATPSPNGTLCQPFTVTTGQVNGLRADSLVFTANGAPPIHPSLATRPPEVGQATITWGLRVADDGKGLAWTRSRQANLLATGTPPVPVETVMLDHLGRLSVEALVGTTWNPAYDSSQANASLPVALRISFAYLLDDGTPGPLHVVVVDLPQRALDPTQTG